MIDVAVAQVVGPASACAARSPDLASGGSDGAQGFDAVLCAAVLGDQPAGQTGVPSGENSDGALSVESGAAVVDTLLAQFLGQMPPSQPLAYDGQYPGANAAGAVETAAPAATTGRLSLAEQGPSMPMAAVHEGVESVQVVATSLEDDAVAGAQASEVQDAVPAASVAPEGMSMAVGSVESSEALNALLAGAGGTDAVRTTEPRSAGGQEGARVQGSGVPGELPGLLGTESSEANPEGTDNGTLGSHDGEQADSTRAEHPLLDLGVPVEVIAGQPQPIPAADQPVRMITDTPPDAVVSVAAQTTDRVMSASMQGSTEARPLTDPALHERVIEQVVREVRLTRLPDRNDLVVRLNPPELGTLRVHITQDAQGMSSQITASTEQVRHLLQSHVPVLVEALAQAGVRMDSVSVTSDVSFGAFMNSSAQGSDYQQAGGQPQGRAPAGQVFGAVALGTSPSTAAADSAAYSWLA